MEGAESARSKKSNQKSKRSVQSLPPSPCCCCDCTCTDEVSKDHKCCLCMPAKCGITSIGLFTMLLTVVFIFSTLVWFMNVYFAWWFTFITLLLYIPLALSTFFFFKFFAGDQEAARGSLPMACWFAIGSFTAVGLWITIYICCIYKKDEVYTAPEPWKEDAYKTHSKKYYVWTTIVINFVLVCLYFYFLYFVTLYNELYDKHFEEDMMMGDDEEK